MTSARGVTIVELLNFVALAAVLATLGMYGFATHLRSSKVAEATATTARIAEAAAQFYDHSADKVPAGTDDAAAKAMRHFPSSSRGSVPGDLDAVRGKLYQSTLGDWAASPWSDLNFSINQAQYYAYSFESAGSGAEAKGAAVAQGDLDGDGKRSTFRVAVAPDDTLHAKVSELEKTNPDE